MQHACGAVSAVRNAYSGAVCTHVQASPSGLGLTCTHASAVGVCSPHGPSACVPTPDRAVRRATSWHAMVDVARHWQQMLFGRNCIGYLLTYCGV